MLTRLAHTFLLLGLLSLLYPNFSHAAQPPQPPSPTPVATQQSKNEWLLQTFDQQNNPIASVPLVIATKHEGFLPVAAICGAKSMRAKGHESQTLEVETITVWPDAHLCKITVKAPGFPSDYAPQREEKLKPGDRVSFIQGLEKSSKNSLTGNVLNRDAFLGAADYETSITVDPTLIGKRVFDEHGTVVGFAFQSPTSCQTSGLISVQSMITADLAEYQAKLYDPSKWAELQVHVNDVDIVRALFADGLDKTNGFQNIAGVLASVGDKLDISNVVMAELLTVINIVNAWEIGKDVPRKFLNAHPDSEYAKLTQATVHAILKECDQAIPALQKLIESTDPRIARSSRYYLSIALICAGRNNAAKVQVEQLHASFPGQVNVLKLMSEYYRGVKDVTNLERVSEELLPLDWSQCHLISNALFLAEAGKRAPVIKIMSEMVVRWPEDTKIRAAAAKYFDKYGMKEKVLEVLREGVTSSAATSADWQLLYTYEHNYRDPHAKITMLDWQEKAPSKPAFLLPATMLIVNEQELDKALEILAKGYVQYSQDPEYMFFYTSTLITNEKVREALKLTKKAIQDLPNESYVKVLHAYALIANSDLESAKQFCEDVLASNPRDADALFLMARIYVAQSNLDECNKMIQRIKSLPPLQVKELREKWKGHPSLKILS